MNHNARVLFLDIETAPILGAVWGLFKQNISLDMIENDWYILSFSAMWMHDKKVIYMDKSASYDDDDDREMLAKIWELLDEADIVVTQNGEKFDFKKINARLILNGFLPPSPYKSVDTLQVAKKTFGFTSKKLEYMTNKLCKKPKLKHAKYSGYLLWKECLKGNQNAWKEMERYNKRDVTSLKELYIKMLPWIKNHPNIGMFVDSDDPVCNNCGSKHIHRRGVHRLRIGTYVRYNCKGCGAWLRGRVIVTSNDERKKLLETT